MANDKFFMEFYNNLTWRRAEVQDQKIVNIKNIFTGEVLDSRLLGIDQSRCKSSRLFATHICIAPLY